MKRLRTEYSHRDAFFDGLVCGAGMVMIDGKVTLAELRAEAELKFPAVGPRWTYGEPPHQPPDEPVGGTQFCPPLHH